MLNLENIIHPRVPCIQSYLPRAKPDQQSNSSQDDAEMDIEEANTGSECNESTLVNSEEKSVATVSAWNSKSVNIEDEPSTSKEKLTVIEKSPVCSDNVLKDIENNKENLDSQVTAQSEEAVKPVVVADLGLNGPHEYGLASPIHGNMAVTKSSDVIDLSYIPGESVETAIDVSTESLDDESKTNDASRSSSSTREKKKQEVKHTEECQKQLMVTH